MTRLRPVLNPYGGSLEQLRASLAVSRPVSARDLIDQLHLGFCDFVPPPPPSYGSGTTPSYAFKPKGGLGKSQLTWSLRQTTISGLAIQPGVKDAFDVWSKAVPGLGFAEVPLVDGQPPCDIDIGTADLGGANPANGKFKLGLTTNRSIQFNSNEDLTFTADQLFATAIHEIGHALGLAHSTVSNSVMYPIGGSVVKLSSDDIAGLRALYGWSAQSLLEGGTECPPALCACGGRLALAWRGAGGDDGIWFATSTDGFNWSPQQQIPGTGTTDGPSLAWDGAKLWMAWRGLDGDDGLYFTTTTDFFSGAALGLNWTGVQNIPNVGSSNGPRIAVAAGLPILVWKGLPELAGAPAMPSMPGDTAVYFSTYFAGRWQPQLQIPGIGTTTSPAICPDLAGVARLVWRGTTGDNALYTSVLLGDPAGVLYWQPQQLVNWIVLDDAFAGQRIGSPESQGAPSIAFATGPKIVAAWRGGLRDDGLYYTQLALDKVGGTTVAEWSAQSVVPNVGSSHGPAIAEFNGFLHLVWKGVPGDDSMWTARFETKPPPP